MALALLPLLAQAVLPLTLPALPPGDPCAPPGRGQSIQHEKITALDLATLANIGRTDPYDSESPFGVSPDGKWIAFLIQRGNPHVNAFCQRLVVMPLDGSETPRELTRGGEFIRPLFRLRSFPAVRAGWAKVITPRWSADGQRIAFLRRAAGSTQVWVVNVTGDDEAHKVTDLPDDVEDFAWSAQGDAIVAATLPGLRLQTEAINREARRGFLYDERFIPEFAPRPIPRGALERHFTRVDLETGLDSEADAADRDALEPAQDAKPAQARAFAAGPGGASAWVISKDPDNIIARSALVMRTAHGTHMCNARLCEGVQRLWWSADGKALYALHRTGWADSQTGLLEWKSGESAPREVFTTEDALIGCTLKERQLLCAREGARQPRRLVAIEPDTGHQRVVYDPNPHFASLHPAQVQRFRFSNAFGVESFADLVLPADARPGEKHPLVVVQYGSQGFLRGGTGDEVPVQVLAAKGFAVLSFERPSLPPEVLRAKTDNGYAKAARKNWIDRRSVQSSLEIAIAMAIKTGQIDPARMGISGFSDGTSTVQWALIHSHLFKVAALGACCEDMHSYPLQAGPEFEAYLRGAGYRIMDQQAERWWRPLSLSLNVAKISAPILVQTGDSEYTTGLDTAATFRDAGKPFELIVLENEGHFKWQPAHRLAIYERFVDWFSFWLMGRVNCSPDKASQYTRWKAMKGAPSTEALTCERPSPAP